MSNHKKLSGFVHTFQVEPSDYFLHEIEPRLSHRRRDALRREAENLVSKLEDAGDRQDFSWLERGYLYLWISQLLQALVEQSAPYHHQEKKQ